MKIQHKYLNDNYFYTRFLYHLFYFMTDLHFQTADLKTVKITETLIMKKNDEMMEIKNERDACSVQQKNKWVLEGYVINQLGSFKNYFLNEINLHSFVSMREKDSTDVIWITKR